MKKIALLSLAFAISAPLHADSLHIFRLSEDGIPGQTEPQLMGFSISANGRYVCGAIEMATGIFVADSQTGEVKWMMGENSGGELRGVNNEGVGIGFFDDGGMLFSFSTDSGSLIPVPSGYRSVQGESISNDGSVMAGSFTGSSFNTLAAYSRDGGEWSLLPLPSDDEIGNLKDKYNENMSSAKFVSGDGKIIMGHVGSFSFPIIWKLDDNGEYVPDFFPARYVKGTEADLEDDTKELYNLAAMYTCMSNNGKYAGGVGVIKGGPYDELFVVPVIYNTESKTLKIYKDVQEIDEMGIGLYPRAIADDGTFVGTVGQPQTGSTGSFIMRAGQEQAELFVDAFPAYAETLGFSDAIGYNVPTGISADGKYILGYTYYSEDFEITSSEPAYWLTYVISTDASAVEEIESSAVQSAPEAIYSVDGRVLSRLNKGLNIVRKSDGSVSKILRK